MMAITTLEIAAAEHTETSRIGIILDFWYMAYTRTNMMTGMTFPLSE